GLEEDEMLGGGLPAAVRPASQHLLAQLQQQGVGGLVAEAGEMERLVVLLRRRREGARGVPDPRDIVEVHVQPDQLQVVATSVDVEVEILDPGLGEASEDIPPV